MAASLIAPPERLRQGSSLAHVSFSTGTSPAGRKRQGHLTAEVLDRALAEKRTRKLTSVEPQRILVVLDDCLTNLRLSQLLPEMSDRLPRLAVQLGSDLHEQMQRHHQLERRYAEVAHEGDEQALAQAECLRESLREVLRLFRENPRVLALLESEAATRCKLSAESETLLREMQQVRENVYEKLLTSKKEDDERTRHLEELRQRQQWRDDDIARLEGDLNRASNDMHAKLDAKNEVAQILREKIAAVENHHQSTVASVSTNAASKLEELKESSRAEQFKQEIKEAKEKLTKSLKQNFEEEHTNRKHKFRIETEVENWIQKFDEDMTERQDKLEEMQAAYDEEKAQLQDLESRFAKLEVEYDAIMLERQQTKEREERMARELQLQMSAAIKLQYFWRKVLQRKALMKKKRKGRKGKGSSRKGSSKKGSRKKKS